MGGRDGRRGDRFERRRFNDWQYYFADNYSRHNWHRGHWGGGWNDRWNTRWNRRWQRYPVALSFGLSPWGIRRMGYWFGYDDYHNPYYGGQPIVVGTQRFDYSQPFVTPVEQFDGPDAGYTTFDQARAEFKARNYKVALKQVDAALQELPQDAMLHEFRALVLFALGDYQPAAATLHAVLAAGPGWDWQTTRELYSSVPEYTRHLRLLEKAVEDDPEVAHLRFLLAEKYLMAGYEEAALKQFSRASELAPKDDVTKQLVAMLSEDQEPGGFSVPEPRTDVKFDEDALQGVWSAKRDGESFQLRLEDDQSFVWTHTQGSTKREVAGVYALEGGTLALEPDAGGVMLANIDLKGRDQLEFQMVGASENDPGITFRK